VTSRELIVEFAPGAGPFSPIGESYVQLDGSAGGDVNTPDHADLDITGDIDIRVEMWLNDWTTGGIYPGLIGKWVTANRSYLLWLLGGMPVLSWSPDGTLTNALDAYPPEFNGVPHSFGRGAVRATMDVDNGSGQRVITFYTAPTLDGPWTQLGNPRVTTGTTSIFSGTASLRMGISATPAVLNASAETTSPPQGRLLRAQVRAGINGAIRANPDFRSLAAGASSHVDSTGKTWSLNGTATAVRYDWVDLSSRVRSATWDIGRDDELDDFPANQATVVLRSNDRHLDPDYTAGPYYGKLLPRVPVRIRSRDTTTLTVSDEWYGFVQNGWQQVPIAPYVWRCELRLGDLFSVLAGTKLPDVFDHAVLSRSPVGYWSLAETNQVEEVTDLAGRNDGTVVGDIKFGERPVQSGGDESALFEAGYDAVNNVQTFGRIELTRGSPVIPGSVVDASVIVAFSARTPASSNQRVLFTQGNGNTLLTGVEFHIMPNGRLRYTFLTSGLGATVEAPASVVDRRGHLAIGVAGGIFLDSTSVITTAVAGGAHVVNGAGIGGAPGVWAEDHFDGWIAAVAVCDHQILTAEAALLLEGFNKLAGKRTDEHLTWALNVLGVPTELRNLDVGTVVLGPADTRDRDAVDWMREVARTEGGSIYIDHRDGGKIRFRHRYARFLDNRSTVSQAAFSDDVNAAAIVRIGRDDLDIAPNGLDGIINQVAVTWRDGTITVEDPDSIARYGYRTRQIDTQATSAAQARSAGEWVLARFSQPRSRLRGLQALGRTRLNRSDLVQALRLDDRVTVRVRPAQVGTANVTALYVDGVTNTVDRSIEWHTSFRFAQGESFTPWIWGTSAWGVDNYWG
jgi:hypothetical protein